MSGVNGVEEVKWSDRQKGVSGHLPGVQGDVLME